MGQGRRHGRPEEVTKLSKSQIDRLGDRLRKQVSDDDARLLNEFVVAQDPVRLEVEPPFAGSWGPALL